MKIQKNLGHFEKLNVLTNQNTPGDIIFEAMDIGPDEWKNHRTKVTNSPFTGPPHRSMYCGHDAIQEQKN